jgi:hypothetical protein
LAALLAATTLGTALTTEVAAASDFSDLPWDQQNAWLLAHIMTPADATRFLGIPGLTMTDGGADRLCTSAPDQGVKCGDKWGGGSWDDAYGGQAWPAAALPRGVSVSWSSRPEDARQLLERSRSIYGVLENLPLQISGYNDNGGRFPVGWSYRVSDGWFVEAYCDPTVWWDREQSKYIYPPVLSADLIDCAKRLVREQFTKLGVNPVEVSPPDPPTSVLLTVKGVTATATWIPPEKVGGLPVTRYEATSSDGALTCSAAPTTELVQSCSATGAKPGVLYTFTVMAHNDAGASPPSRPSRSSKFTARASAPRDAVAKVASTTAVLNWKRPAALGGLPVLRYVVTASPGSLTCTTNSLACAIAGLDYSTRYRFQVRAINGRGAGTPATTKWVRTAAPPPPLPPPSTPEPEKLPSPIS